MHHLAVDLSFVIIEIARVINEKNPNQVADASNLTELLPDTKFSVIYRMAK